MTDKEVAMRVLMLLALAGLLGLLSGCNQQQMMQDAQRPNATPPAHFNEPLWP
jgi:hypothetical protein